MSYLIHRKKKEQERQTGHLHSGTVRADEGGGAGANFLRLSSLYDFEHIYESFLRYPYSATFLLFPYVLQILTHKSCSFYRQLLKEDFLDFSFFQVLYSTLLHLPLLRFHCVGACRDRTQNCCDFGIDSQTL